MENNFGWTTDKFYYPGLAKSCRKKLDKVLAEIRIAAREHGYAVAIHGSCARDIDLVCVPWADKVFRPSDLRDAIVEAIEEANGSCYIRDDEREPSLRPHGRLSYVFHLGSGVYIDLAIFPPTNEPAVRARHGGE